MTVIRPEIIMPQTFAVILFLNSFKILLLFPNPLPLLSTNEEKNIVNACYTAASVNIHHRLAGWGCCDLKEEFLIEKTHVSCCRTKTTNQLHYSCSDPC